VTKMCIVLVTLPAVEETYNTISLPVSCSYHKVTLKYNKYITHILQTSGRHTMPTTHHTKSARNTARHAKLALCITYGFLLQVTRCAQRSSSAALLLACARRLPALRLPGSPVITVIASPTHAGRQQWL